VEYPFLTGLGLAAPAGLNAYLPLLIVALVDRFSTKIDLDSPFDFLGSNWGIVILTVLVTVEVVVPAKLNGKAREAVEAFRDATADEDPRTGLFDQAERT